MLKHLIISLIFFSTILAQAKPKVSIITCINNISQTTKNYLLDITQQTIFNNCELILINQDNKNRNIKFLEDYLNKFKNIIYVDNTQDSINNYYTGLNIGIERATADLVCCANEDDRSEFDSLEIHAKQLEENAHIDLVYSNYLITYIKNETFNNNHYRWLVNQNEFSKKNMHYCLPGPRPMWRKSLHEKYGYFDESYLYSSNWEMWLRATAQGAVFKKIDTAKTLYYAEPETEEKNAIIDQENSLIIKKYNYVWNTTEPEPAAIIAITENKNKFVVVIPSYNNKYWVQRNLDSVFMQTYKNFRIIYIDDASADKTGELVQKYIDERGFSDKAVVIRNPKNKGALANLYTAISTCTPDEIIVDLDGDDWFANENVLALLNTQYSDPNIWVTYGQFNYYPDNINGWAEEVPLNIIDENRFRNYPWVTTALRTFYAGLFHKIKREDLLFEGKFFPMASDPAFMFPIVEMAGRHSKFIPDILYIYNRATALNDDLINRELQLDLNRVTLGREKYNKIEKPFNAETAEKKKKIYITPGQWGVLFDANNVACNRDNCLKPVIALKETLEKLNYKVEEAYSLGNLHDAEFIITFDIPADQLENLKKYPKEKLIAFLWEPPTTAPENYDKTHHEYFSRIYTWDDNLVDNIKYFKFYYPVANPMIKNATSFENKKLCTLIAANKGSNHENELYSTRLKVINFFEEKDNSGFDFYGKFWNKNIFKNYKGMVERKSDILKDYKFSFTYENIKGLNGYITEKIFDSFHAGCVPIYLGSSDIDKYVPKNCYISRDDFKTEEELYNFIKNISKTEYEEYITNIQNFLESDQAYLYSVDNFVQIFLDACLPK